MRVALADVPEEPVWPDGIIVRTFRPGDERIFYDLHQETFEDHWEHNEPDPYDEWAHWMLQPPMFDPDLWLLAEQDGEPAAIEINHPRPEMPDVGWVGILGVRRAWRRRGLGRALLLKAFHEFRARGYEHAGLGVDAASVTGATQALRERRHARHGAVRHLREAARVSRLRARCPYCRTLTAVALGPTYECHVCGRAFAAGLVRVPRAWGKDGEAMAEAAGLPLLYPEASVVEEDTLEEQTLAIAADLPERPLVLGGCCCAHHGAIEGLGPRYGRLAVVWLDAHGDLNTVESSPSGNPWATPLRMAIEAGAVEARDVALVGARNLDPPEEEYIAETGIHRDDVDAALEGAEAVYVAIDADVLRPGEVSMFMPEPGGPTLDEVETLLERVATKTRIAGVGVTALRPDPSNVEPVARLLRALGL